MFIPMFTAHAYRATRLVVMPEWQGAGVGTKFLEYLCEYHAIGLGRCGKKYPTIFHTSHPQLCEFFRRSKNWVQKSLNLYGGEKAKSEKSLKKAARKGGSKEHDTPGRGGANSGFGGHFRAVQGFKYIKRPE